MYPEDAEHHSSPAHVGGGEEEERGVEVMAILWAKYENVTI